MTLPDAIAAHLPGALLDWLEDNRPPEELFRELGVEPDEEKLRYYLLLDELF